MTDVSAWPPEIWTAAPAGSVAAGVLLLPERDSRIDAHRPRDWHALRDRRDEHPHRRNAGKRRGIGRAHVVPWKKSDKTRM